jgi:phosphomannomutase
MTDTSTTSATTGLHFGTAGLRAPMGPGPDQMNRETVRRVSAGLARYVADRATGERSPSIVVGFDARHHSAQFAADASGVFAAAGLRSLMMAEPAPTPVLAFAVRELGCAAGVMITASHNPATDNGYKVYGADGAQIIPPADGEISACIDRVRPGDEIGLAEPEGLGGEVLERYLAAIVPAALRHAPTQRDVAIVYTPVHGVGRSAMLPALARAGFPPPHVVARQADPDPDFPTAPRPNPEEPGVMDLALGDARERGADVVLANDPDADRLAVAVPWPGVEGGWRMLGGDEVGSLIAEELLGALDDPAGALLVTSVVSGTMLGAQARAAGTQYAETLTGFKWIMHVAEQSPARLLLGYEQALGYGVTELVRDKDGISAGLVVAAIAARARAEGTTIKARLDALAERFGLHAAAERSLALASAGDADHAEAEIARLRDNPPAELIGRELTAVDDLSSGERRERDGRRTSLGLPPSSGVILRAGDAVRLAVRPSGTEPKLKLYLQVVLPVSAAGADAARAQAAPRLDALATQAEELIAR